MKKVVPFTKTISFRTMIAEITDIEVNHTLALNENHEVVGDILVDGKYKMTDASQIEEEFHYKLPFTIDIDERYNLDNLEIIISDFYFEIINEEDLKINVEIEMDGIEENKLPKLEEKRNSLEEVSEVLDTEEDFVRNKEDDILIPVEIEEKKEKLEVPQDNPLHKLAEEIKKDILTEDIPLVEVTKQEAKKEIKKETTSVKQEKDNNTSSTNMSSIFSSLASSEETFSTYYVYMVRETDTIESIIDKYQTTKEELQNYNDLTNVKVGSKLIIPCASRE
ncbi:LysM peptidoglycan-binding domain-containing protein [bacterium]|nr:LysM peptidoglycan-binding domain-containing protein [bacterium]